MKNKELMFSWRSRRIPTLYWWIPHHEIQQLRKNTPWAFKTLKITAGIKNTQNMQKWHLYMFTISFRDFIHKSSTSETQQLLCDWMNCKRDCNLMTRLLLIVNKWVSEWVSDLYFTPSTDSPSSNHFKILWLTGGLNETPVTPYQRL